MVSVIYDVNGRESYLYFFVYTLHDNRRFHAPVTRVGERLCDVDCLYYAAANGQQIRARSLIEVAHQSERG